MLTENTKSIISVEGEQGTSVTVDSEMLEYFLIGTDVYFPYKNWHFTKHLKLSQFAEIFNETFKSRVEVPIYSEEYKQAMKKGLSDSSSHYQDILKALEKTSAAERITTILYDPADHTYKYIPINHGEYYSVTTPILDYLDDYFPIIEVHTHPHNNLFSPVDYTRLLTKGYTSNRRVVNGIVILNPDCQVMALPSFNTPLLEVDEADQLLEEETEKYMEEFTEIEEKRIKRIGKISTATMKRIIEIGKEVDKVDQEEIRRREFDGALTQYEGEELRARLYEVADRVGERLRERAIYLSLITNYKDSSKKNLFDSTFLIDLARRLHVQLFMSTDMRHFTQWTA